MHIRVHQDQSTTYPYTMRDLRRDNPQVSFPAEPEAELLAEYGVFPVEPTTPPAATAFQRVVEAPPVLVRGAWHQQWAIVPASPPESITRRQCALQLLATKTITPEEALAMTKAGDVPAAIAAIFEQAVANGTMTQEQRILAEIDFAAANYYRSNSLLSLMGLTEAEIDQFFIAAAQL